MSSVKLEDGEAAKVFNKFFSIFFCFGRARIWEWDSPVGLQMNPVYAYPTMEGCKAKKLNQL